MGPPWQLLVGLVVCMVTVNMADTFSGTTERASDKENSETSHSNVRDFTLNFVSTSTTNMSPSSSPSSSHVPPSSIPSSSHVPPSSIPSSSHVPPSSIPSSSHVPPSSIPSSSHVPPSSIPSSSHMPKNSIPSSSHEPPSSIPLSSHVPPSSIPSSSHVPLSSSPSSSHVPPSSIPSSSHVPPSSISSSSHVPPSSIPSSSHVPPSSIPSSSHVPPSSIPSSSHMPKNSIPSSSHEPPSSIPLSSHVPPSSIPSSSHVPPSSIPSSSHMPKNSIPSSSHEPPSSIPLSSHVPPSSIPSSSHVPLSSSPSSSHVPPSSIPSSSHVPPSSSPSSSHVPPSSIPSSSHVPPSSIPSSSHVPLSSSPSSSHVPPSSIPSSSHVPPSSSPSSSHVPPSSSSSSSHVPPSSSPSSSHVPPSSIPSSSHMPSSSIPSSSHMPSSSSPSSSHVPSSSSSKPSSPSSSPNPSPSSSHMSPSSSPNMSVSTVELSTITNPTRTTPSSSPVSGKVTIMEVYYNLPQSPGPDDLPEFIELYGDRSLSLQGYTIVLYTGETMQGFLIISLDNYSLPSTNAAFLISTFNASFGPDIVLANKSLTSPDSEITMVTLYKNASSSFTVGSTPSHWGLVDYVVYSSGTADMPSVIRNWGLGFKAVVKDNDYPYESVSRCFSDEPDNQRAFTLSPPTPGKKNSCDLRDDYPVINEVGHLGTHHSCFIEIQFTNNASQALNSIFLAIYSKASTPGHPIQNVTFDLWNERINQSGYYLLSGNSNGSLALDCERTFIGGTNVIVLYQVPTDLKHFNKKFAWDNTYKFIKDGVAFNISDPLDTNLAQIVLPEAKVEGFPRVSVRDGPSKALFLSGSKSLSSCGRSIYNMTDPTPGEPNICPLLPSTRPPVTVTTTHPTVKPNHIYINEVTYSAKNSEEYIEFKGDLQGDFSHYYIILFNTCHGTKIGGVPLNHALDEHGFLQFNHTSTHTFSETLRNTGSIALALYTNNVPAINITQGLLDAIVMTTSTNVNCPSLSFSLKYLTPNVLKPVVLKESDLDGGMTLSRCFGNLRNSTAFKVTKYLTQSTPATENICGNPVPPVLPSTKKGPDPVLITIAVVASCLVVFLIIFGVLVVIMKRKRRGVLQFRLALMAEGNDDDEVLTNLDGEEDLINFNMEEDAATFDNKTY